MSNVETRNKKITSIISTFYTTVTNNKHRRHNADIDASIEKLFSTDTWGFREVILVVAVGMKLDSKFRATKKFYDCNPRAIFEGPIKEFLICHSLPHRKSGPLNIAKAAVGLDETWAAQRRPVDVATETVKLIRLMEKSPSMIDVVAESVIDHLIYETKSLEKLEVSLEPSSDPVFLYHVCQQLIDRVPDKGNTPQKISACLLKAYHNSLGTNIVVTGGEDSASVTSTTSKKPGDVNEESRNGEIFKVYEVTVKPFDLPRIRDSFDCVSIYNQTHTSTPVHEVIVICRPQDCPECMKESSLNEFMGEYKYKDIIYYFWNIYEWSASTLQRMTQKGRNMFHTSFNTYVNDINTAKSVKELWSELN